MDGLNTLKKVAATNTLWGQPRKIEGTFND